MLSLEEGAAETEGPLRARRKEIEQALMARIQAVSDPREVEDPEYLPGLHEAVRIGLDYGIAALEGGDGDESIPPQLLLQARRAARNGVGLDTVLRRYLAGHALLCDCVLQETEAGDGAEPATSRRTLRAGAALLDRLTEAIARAYVSASEQQARTAEQRRADLVGKLLDGDLADADELPYRFDDWHLAVVASGSGVTQVIRAIASASDRRLLLVRPAGGTIWAWFGGRQRLDVEEIANLAAGGDSGEVSLAIGEPGRGMRGWRLTHRQARAAYPIAVRGNRQVVSYSSVAIVASVWADDVLAQSLAELYLAPLAKERDGGAILRETLRAYFNAGRNVASAAAALGVSRQTVNSRLIAVEKRLDRRLEDCGSDLETALHLHALGHFAASSQT